MKRYLFIFFVAALVVTLVLTPLMAYAQSSAAGRSSGSGPGAAFAQTITTVTGVAISPLLALSAVGAWQYFKAEKKDSLPFYAQFWFWLPGLLLAGAVALKDTLGAATPPGLKKPLDVAEVIENKVSGLAAAGALIPLVTSIFHHLGSADAGASLSAAGFAAIGGSDVLGVLTLPFALAAYVVVWLVSHAINILILISPWGGIDAALKGARTALLGSLALIASIDPMVGAVLSLIVVLLAWAVAGWSFRLLVFGSVLVWDFVTGRRKRFLPSREAMAFTARKLDKVPVRTLGTLVPGEGGKFLFRFRPWLMMAERAVEIPAGNLAVGNAFLYPSLIRSENGSDRSVFNFPPRYRGHEAEMARLYQLEVRDIGLIKGFKAAWQWFRELFGAGPQPASVAS